MAVRLAHALLAVHVGLVVREKHVVVAGEQRVHERAEELAIAVGEEPAGDQVDGFAQLLVRVVGGARVVALALSALTSPAVRPNRKKFSCPTASRISTLAPSSVPMVNAPFIANFMLPVPDASLPAVEICSDRSAAG